MKEVLKATDISVSFGGVRALDRVSFAVEEGEIHGVIGPNGAGKTTAINVLTGFIPQRGGGNVVFEGKPLPERPFQIARAGIARTFQASAIFPDLSAGENVMCAGNRWTRAGLFGCMLQSKRARNEEDELRKAAATWLERVGFASSFDTPMKSLPFGEQRKVEIARALMAKPRLLLLDEPTAGLTADEVSVIAKLLKSLKRTGDDALSVLLIEHNVPFIFSLCDRVTALDNGMLVATGTPAEIRAKKEVIASYLGGQAEEGAPATASGPPAATPTPAPAAIGRRTGTEKPSQPAPTLAANAETILDVRSIDAGYGRVKVVRGLSFTVKAGELVAICGRNGAGKSTLLNALTGQPRISSGEVHWLGERVEHLAVSDIIRRGMVLVPQERGVISEQSVDANLRLSTIGLGLNRAKYQERREEMLERFPRLRERIDQLAGTLSGGERQMLALAKVLIRKPRLLLMDEPSIGLAPTIVENLQRMVADISRDGIAVIVAEQNVWWVAPLAMRAFLIESGKFVAEGKPEDIIHRERVLESFLGKEIEGAAH
jgi:ABC-type branched-subunit amino acid transport system ATPase component